VFPPPSRGGTMLNKEQKVQECDATDDDSSTEAGFITRNKKTINKNIWQILNQMK
jgi:hypothetical protein